MWLDLRMERLLIPRRSGEAIASKTPLRSPPGLTSASGECPPANAVGGPLPGFFRVRAGGRHGKSKRFDLSELAAQLIAAQETVRERGRCGKWVAGTEQTLEVARVDSRRRKHADGRRKVFVCFTVRGGSLPDLARRAILLQLVNANFTRWRKELHFQVRCL